MRGKKQRIRRDGTRSGHATLSAARCRAYGKGEGDRGRDYNGGKRERAAATIGVKGKDAVATVGKCGGGSNGYDVTAHGVGILF
ncbi:MAG: hypothetical protein OXP71_00220 [Candidatus Poribacteria bacterium]|nr:hypothetical protein [Candidatus Poribacteria bacterium]